MKKVLSSLLAVLVVAFLITPLASHADMGTPAFNSYKMQVTSPSGVEYYLSTPDAEKSAGTLPKDTIVTIDYEGKSDSYGIYYSFRSDNNKKTSGYLRSLNGLVLLKDSITLEDIKNDDAFGQSETKQKALVYKEGGVDLLKGPAAAYEKIATFEKGTILEFQYYLGGDGDSKSYIYVETEKGKGWVNLLGGEVLIENNVEYIFRKDKTISNDVTIPANTILKPEYRTDEWSKKALFKYNGAEALLNTFRDDVALSLYEAKYTTTKELDIYKTAEGSEVVGKLPQNAEFVHKASYSEEEYNTDSPEDVYLEYNGIQGWIRLSTPKEISWVNNQVNPGARAENVVTNTVTVGGGAIWNQRNEINVVNEVNDPKPGMSMETVVLMCSMAGISVALAAVVIILLVNKKTKNNVQNTNMNQTVNQNINQNINPVQSNDQNQNKN